MISLIVGWLLTASWFIRVNNNRKHCEAKSKQVLEKSPNWNNQIIFDTIHIIFFILTTSQRVHNMQSSFLWLKVQHIKWVDKWKPSVAESYKSYISDCLIITLRRRTTARIMFQAKKYERVTRFDILDPYRTVVANIEIQHETSNDGELYLLDSVWPIWFDLFIFLCG